MSRIRQRPVYDPSLTDKEVPSTVAPVRPAAEARDASPTEKPAKIEQSRFTFYAPVETVEHLNDLLYLASKQGAKMKIRDRTHIVRALVEAFRRSGHGLGSCCTEGELVEALTRKLAG